ncbi:MAG: hypothetical protein AABX03_05075 [Nanoarchaeota archaeon]|mgnify:CR=1 FL=1
MGKDNILKNITIFIIIFSILFLITNILIQNNPSLNYLNVFLISFVIFLLFGLVDYWIFYKGERIKKFPLKMILFSIIIVLALFLIITPVNYYTKYIAENALHIISPIQIFNNSLNEYSSNIGAIIILSLIFFISYNLLAFLLWIKEKLHK